MMHDEKKKDVAALIIAKMKKPEPDAQEEQAEGSDEGEMAAADEIISAVHSKDSKALAEALESFYEMCSNKH